MPIVVEADIRRPGQDEFGKIAYKVMEVVFAVHRQLGRFLDEAIYQAEIANRLDSALIELPIRVSHDDFAKTYFVDLLVSNSAPFELKTVSFLTAQHRAQLLNYLLLAELPHGKLISLRPESVEHEFVNTTLTGVDRRRFSVHAENWDPMPTLCRDIRQWLLSALHDWGTGLDLHLYEGACVHFFGGEEVVNGRITITVDGRPAGFQPVRLAAPGIAFKVTCLCPSDLDRFEDHARRFLIHSSLDAILWINISIGSVHCSCLPPQEGKSVGVGRETALIR